jgi:MFS family permease
MNNLQHNYEVPNGGYGYVVTFGAMIINATNQAVISVFGLLFEPYFTTLKESKTRIALVMNLSSVFLNLSGLMIAPLLKKFSPRQVAIAGCSLVGLGFMLSSQTTKLEQVLVTYSFMVGIGLGVLGPSIFLAITPYFTTKKSRAMGLAMSGTGFGQMILPQVVKTFLNISDFSGASLFVGTLSLFGIAGAILFHPVEWHMKRVESDSESMPLITNEISNGKLNGHSNNLQNGWEKLPPKNEGFLNKISKSLDLILLKDVRFIIINVGLAVVYAVSVDFTLILPYFLQVLYIFN